MEREDRRQLELFSLPAPNPEQKPGFSDSFFGYIRGYERIILFTIALIFTGTIFFSLGVEKGKRCVSLEFSPEFNVVPAQERQTVNAKQELQPPQEETEQKQKKEENLKNYTIQVATFSEKASAQKEAETLKKKGMTAAVIKKGSYNIVCVGSFAKKDLAKSLLTKLKKQYRDGFIRRL